MFNLALAGTFVTLAILGHYISGYIAVVIVIFVGAILAIKYDCRLVRINAEDFEWSRQIHDDGEQIDEFLLETDPISATYLRQASTCKYDELAVLPGDKHGDDSSDEIPADLLITDSIPEINENSSDDDDELVPAIRHHTQQQQQAEKSAAAVSNSSSSRTHDEIKFIKGHFKRDSSLSSSSSSSSVECLSKGLQFPDHTAIDGATSKNAAAPLLQAITAEATQAVLAQSGRLLPNLIAGVLSRHNNAEAVTFPDPHEALMRKQRAAAAAAATHDTDTSDGSDFEIIDDEELE